MAREENDRDCYGSVPHGVDCESETIGNRERDESLVLWTSNLEDSEDYQTRSQEVECGSAHANHRDRDPPITSPEPSGGIQEVLKSCEACSRRGAEEQRFGARSRTCEKGAKRFERLLEQGCNDGELDE